MLRPLVPAKALQEPAGVHVLHPVPASAKRAAARKSKVSCAREAYFRIVFDGAGKLRLDDEQYFFYILINPACFRCSIRKAEDLEEEKVPDLARPIPVRST